MLRRMFIFACVSLFVLATAGCDSGEKTKTVNLKDTKIVKTQQNQPAENQLRVAVGGMITPREGFTYYKKFLDYIGEKTNMHVEFVDRENYAEINNLIKDSEVDAAFVCGGPYVDGKKEFNMELLAAPVAYGESVYYSYIIVPKNSAVRNFKELRGKTFAFTDPLSNSGKLVPTYMLAKMQETPESFFKKVVFTQAHDKSIKAIAEGIADGAAVDSLIWEYTNRTNPRYTSQTRIIEKSPPYGIPPFVVRPGLGPAVKKKLRETFFNAHQDARGREILKGMMVEKFIPIDDKAYDSIREMKLWIAQNKQK